MQDLLANVLLALGVATSPAPDKPDYKWFGTTSVFHIDIDLNSLYARPEGMQWIVKSRLRFRLIEPVKLEGKKKEGAYYLDDTTTNCSTKRITLDRVSLYAADGEVIASGTKVGEMPKSDDPNDFVTSYVNFICANAPKAGTFLEA